MSEYKKGSIYKKEKNYYFFDGKNFSKVNRGGGGGGSGNVGDTTDIFLGHADLPVPITFNTTVPYEYFPGSDRIEHRVRPRGDITTNIRGSNSLSLAGKDNEIGLGGYNFVSGLNNTINKDDSYSPNNCYIIGGSGNSIHSGDYNGILNGRLNYILEGSYNTIAGKLCFIEYSSNNFLNGENCEIASTIGYPTYNNVILNGLSNFIKTSTTYSSILNGTTNIINDNEITSTEFCFIGNGNLNKVLYGFHGVIINGQNNIVKGRNTILTGENNTCEGTDCTIIAGNNNSITSVVSNSSILSGNDITLNDELDSDTAVANVLGNTGARIVGLYYSSPLTSNNQELTNLMNDNHYYAIVRNNNYSTPTVVMPVFSTVKEGQEFVIFLTTSAAAVDISGIGTTSFKLKFPAPPLLDPYYVFLVSKIQGHKDEAYLNDIGTPECTFENFTYAKLVKYGDTFYITESYYSL